MIARWLAVIVVALASLAAPAATRAEPLIADLTSHLIGITTGFTGTEVVLFGAVEDEGDVIVVVRGPDMPVAVRRKERVFGIWLNRRSVTFPAVPSFYTVASSRPLAEIAAPETLANTRIGLETLSLQPDQTLIPSDREAFTAALIDEKRKLGLFPEKPGKIAFLGNRLFRTTLYFPANLPTGGFQVSVYLFRNGKVIGAQTTPLLVSPIGLAAEMVRIAYRQPLLYGGVAVLVAVMAGYAAGFAFRRA